MLKPIPQTILHHWKVGVWLSILGGGVLLLSSVLLLSDVGIAMPSLLANCTTNCGSRQIQFTPGQPVRLQMANRTASLVQIQQRPLTDTIALTPGAEVEIRSNFGTEPNLSVIFWDETALSIRAILFRPEPNVLRIELVPGSGTGDRSVYIENDGRVRLF
jgi:hypothetical protein